MKNYPKPPLIEMMKSLYYLYSIGMIKKTYIEDYLHNSHLIDDIKYEDNKMSCVIYKNENLEIESITSIPI